MNKKIATLGIVSAGIAALTAFVGAARRGRATANSSDGARPTGTTPPDNGPTAHAQPAPTGDEGHAVPDLAADAAPGQRAPEAFRPDMDAPMTPAEREALRPATGPAPSLSADGAARQPATSG